MDREIELACGGKRVALGKFVKVIVLNTVLGLLKSLKGIDVEGEISLRIGAAAR